MPPKMLVFLSSASTAFSGGALIEAFGKQDWKSWLPFWGSAIATALSWLVSYHAKISRQKQREQDLAREHKREQDRMDREVTREQEWQDFIISIKKDAMRRNTLTEAAMPTSPEPTPTPILTPTPTSPEPTPAPKSGE